MSDIKKDLCPGTYVKLNMVELKASCKGKFRNTLCRRCGAQDGYIVGM